MRVQIRTILLVTLVTVLIWVWAEGESLSTVDLNPRIAFQDSSDLLIRTGEDWRGTVRLRLKGSTRAIEDARRGLSSQLRLWPGRPGVPSEPGDRQVVNLEQAISQLDEIRSAGLSIQEIDPASTVVRIVKIVSKDLPVRPRLPTDIDVLGEATVSPPRVTVRMPEPLLARLSADAFVEASLTKADIGMPREDAAQTTVTAAVRLPGPLQGEEGVSVSPEKVTVSFRLKRSVDTYALASVPVWFSLPPTEGTGWDIELTDQFLSDVTFTGPTDAVAKIRSREVVPIAEVRLSSDDLEKSISSKEAVFINLPGGVEAGTASRTVRLKITKRKATNGEPQPLSVPEPAGPGGNDNN